MDILSEINVYIGTYVCSSFFGAGREGDKKGEMRRKGRRKGDGRRG